MKFPIPILLAAFLAAASDEWTIWKRDGSETGLSRMVGNSAYLIRCSGAVSVPIKQLVPPPLATWLISGGNFLGFPSATAGPPKMSSYFASYPSASTTVLATPAKIYKYIGGELASSNPMLVSPGAETLDPNKASWFNVATVGNFTAPVEYEVASSAGLAFGRTQTVGSIGITNRSTSSLTLTLTLGSSEAAPGSHPAISGGVPLTRRIFNSTINAYTETAMAGSFTITRTCQFTFTASPPDGQAVSGWGTAVLGGSYRETITGLHKNTLEARGSFQMNRVSEIASIDLTAP